MNRSICMSDFLFQIVLWVHYDVAANMPHILTSYNLTLGFLGARHFDEAAFHTVRSASSVVFSSSPTHWQKRTHNPNSHAKDLRVVGVLGFSVRTHSD
jgi:hypothetical protein